MAEIAVIQAPVEQDLGEFSRILWQQHISHRIFEQEGMQYLLVGNEHDARHVDQAYRQYQAGELSLDSAVPRPVKKAGLPPATVLRAPVTLIAIVLSVLGYFLVKYDGDFELVRYLTFFHFDFNWGGQVVFQLPRGEYWRLITPVFLHFSLLHIVFNMLWLWDLGRRVEILQGSGRMLAMVLLIGVGSNLTQSMFAQVGIFGGMSGVIYGLLGYGWIWSTLRPEQSLHIPNSVLNFMLAWLVLCMFGIAELLGAGAVANAAHVGGLLMGMVLGGAAGLIAKMSD